MGLAGQKKRTKISHDPNNTTWYRSEDNYGHRIMRSQGWTPGNYLGASNANHAQNFTPGSASFVRAILKDDTLGLGAKPHSKKAEDEPTGLDAFQDLLGRLNGKSETELETEQRKRGDVKLLSYVESRWKSMNFVKGGLLKQEKMPESSAPKEVGGQADSAASQEEKVKKSKKTRRKEKARNGNLERGDLDDGAAGESEMKVKSSKSKEKKNKKKKSKDRKAGLSEQETSSGDTAKSKKRKRKDKDKQKASETSMENSSESEKLSTPATKPTGGLVVSKENKPRGRQVLRARSIQQKKAALMDDKSLNEIFMARA